MYGKTVDMAPVTARSGQPPPRVSIVVPCFNAITTVESCISSILAQNYRELEVIAVDDCSTDGTRELLDRLALGDGRLKVIHSPANGGPHKARQLGLEAAAGTLIGFVDSDDRVQADFVSALALPLIRHQADIAICGFMRVDEHGVSHAHRFTAAEKVVDHDILLRFSQFKFGSGLLWNKLFRSGLIRDHMAFPLERSVDFGEDYIVSVGCFAASARVVVVPGTPYEYLFHAGSGSRAADAGRAFARILNGYAKCLEVHSDKGEAVLQCIDRIYRHQLRFEGYSVADPSALRRHRDMLSSALERFARTRPEALHSLIHTFDPTLDPPPPQKLRYHLGQVRRSLGSAVKALFHGRA